MNPLGEVLRITVIRAGRSIGFSMHVEEPPVEPEPSGTEGRGPLADARFEASFADQKGVKIVDLKLRAPLARAGLQLGDVIVAVNRKHVTTVEALFQSMSGTGPVTLLVRRDNSELFVVLR
jgi:serine protease DegQ